MKRMAMNLGLVLVLSLSGTAAAGFEDDWTSKQRIKTAAAMLLERAELVHETATGHGAMQVHANLTRHFAALMVQSIDKDHHPAVLNARLLAIAVHWRLTEMFYAKQEDQFPKKLSKLMARLSRSVFRMSYNLRAGQVAKEARLLRDKILDFADEAKKLQQTSFLGGHGNEIADQLELLAQSADDRLGFQIVFDDFEFLRAMYCASEEATRAALTTQFGGKYKVNHRAILAQLRFRDLHRAVLTAIPHLLESGTSGMWEGCGIKGFLHGPVNPDGGGPIVFGGSL